VSNKSPLRPMNGRSTKLHTKLKNEPLLQRFVSLTIHL